MASISSEPPHLSSHAQRVLTLLRDYSNVLLSGPPATGKSRLLAELRGAFQWTPTPGYQPEHPIPLPSYAAAGKLAPWMPSPDRPDRRVFMTAFDQNTKQRDILRGLVPVVDKEATSLAFQVSKGTLYRAAEHALTDRGASLVIIDEINRGRFALSAWWRRGAPARLEHVFDYGTSLWPAERGASP